MKNNWRVWDNDKKYGKLFYSRATGKLSEMESSKAAAKHVSKLIKPGYKILDVGCGSGHYLVSLDRTLNSPFSYHGIDATEYYVKLARKAFIKPNKNSARTSCEFDTGDIFALKLPNDYADVVMCNNVLLHLPSIDRPIRELWRVAKRFLVIRTLLGETSFRIQQINSPEKYTDQGEPLNFHYFNIYSKKYMSELIGKLNKIKKHRFVVDNDYRPANIGGSNYKKQKAPRDLTSIISGMQVNNYIIQPWQFLIIEKKN